MNESCGKCCRSFEENESVITCDGCTVLLHKECARISPTESRAVVIQNRSLMFFCFNCRETFKQIPRILNGLKDALHANEILRAENESLRNELTAAKESGGSNSDIHSVVSEVHERQIRASNVIIRGVQESGKSTSRERVQDDMSAVEKLLAAVGTGFVIRKIFRLGKYGVDRIRPIKIVLSSSEEALSILKARNKINVPGVVVHHDETKIQREFYFAVKKKLDELVAAGEDKIIRYVNNLPTIIDRPKHQKKK